MDFKSILHGDVLLAKQRPWEGHKSGQLCGQVVEFMSVYDKCFIERGSSLVRLKTGYSYCFQDPGLACLLLDGFFRDAIDAAQSDWRAVVSYAVNSGVPTPCFSTALAFYDGYRSERLPANLIQVKKHFYLMTSISNLHIF